MDYLSPSLTIIAHFKRTIEQGKTVRTGLLQLNCASSEDQIFKALKDLREEGEHFNIKSNFELSPLKLAVISTIHKGLCGQSIYQQLCELEIEASLQLEVEIEKYVKKIPIILLGPLFLIIFPSFGILIFLLVTQTA